QLCHGGIVRSWPPNTSAFDTWTEGSKPDTCGTVKVTGRLYFICIGPEFCNDIANWHPAPDLGLEMGPPPSAGSASIRRPPFIGNALAELHTATTVANWDCCCGKEADTVLNVNYGFRLR